MADDEDPIRRAVRRSATLVGVVVAIAVGGYFYFHSGMMYDPAYGEPRLLGLTPAQVVQRLGPPDYDPRRLPFGSTTGPVWSSEATDGPLALGYFQGWATCTIRFRNGRVTSVERFYK